MARCAREVRTESSWLETHAMCARRGLWSINWNRINSLLPTFQLTIHLEQKNRQSACTANGYLFS